MAGNTWRTEKVDIVLNEQEAEAVGTVVDMELCGHHPPEAEAIFELRAGEDRPDCLCKKVQTITCHGKDDFWSAEIPKRYAALHSARKPRERVGTLMN